jgi:hypothetical protein
MTSPNRASGSTSWSIARARSERSAPIYERTEDEIDTVLTLHAKAPLLLTTGLIDVLSSGARMLSVSTRSAHATFPGPSM